MIRVACHRAIGETQRSVERTCFDERRKREELYHRHLPTHVLYVLGGTEMLFEQTRIRKRSRIVFFITSLHRQFSTLSPFSYQCYPVRTKIEAIRNPGIPSS